MTEDIITIVFHRKAYFRAGFVGYRLYVDGNFIGIIKNGQTVSTNIKRAEGYLLEIDAPFGVMAYYAPDGACSQFEIGIEAVGGWKTAVLPAFVISDGRITIKPERSHPLMVPSQANAAAEQMPANIVSLCREFWYAILDDDEIWYHDNLN